MEILYGISILIVYVVAFTELIRIISYYKRNLKLKNACCLDSIFENENDKEKKTIIAVLICAFVGFLFTNTWLKEMIGNVSLEDYTSGIHSFQVEVIMGSKKYITDGEIYIDSELYSTGESEDYFGQSHSELEVDKHYYLNRVYFNDGTFVTFRNADMMNEVYPNEQNSLIATNGSRYNCILVDKHVNSKYINEDKKMTFWNVVFTLFVSILYLYNLYVAYNRYCKEINETKKETEN